MDFVSVLKSNGMELAQLHCIELGGMVRGTGGMGHMGMGMGHGFGMGNMYGGYGGYGIYGGGK